MYASKEHVCRFLNLITGAAPSDAVAQFWSETLPHSVGTAHHVCRPAIRIVFGPYDKPRV